MQRHRGEMCAVTNFAADDLVLTVDELAAELRIARRSAYDLVASGQIRSVRIGRAGKGIRVPRSALNEFLAGQTWLNHRVLYDPADLSAIVGSAYRLASASDSED
jgi:excisionase family DNA binding protein